MDLKDGSTNCSTDHQNSTNRPKAKPCFACGRSFVSGGDGRFCSPRCRSWYDGGGMPVIGMRHQYSTSLGSNGFLFQCGGCGKTFDSKGLRCCSAQCEAQL
jgi:hypothetical protein